jgi:hypothetical protein
MEEKGDEKTTTVEYSNEEVKRTKREKQVY